MINQWTQTLWGEYKGKKIYLFSFKNNDGSFVEIINYGAIVKSIVIPDKNEVMENVVLSYPDFSSYQQDSCYLGATIGRFANRIRNAAYTFDDKVVELTKNDGVHQNHGGDEGFHNKVFEAYIEGDTLALSISSPCGEGGFPGNVQFKVRYCWTEDHELRIRYQAITNHITPLNFTNHAYFNLSGKNTHIWSHILDICAENVLETTANFIPTGNIMPINSVYPNNGKNLSASLNINDGYKGLNHYFITKKSTELTWKSLPVAKLFDPGNGRRLEVFTSYPGLQIYTGDYLKTKVSGSDYHQPFQGICLECQLYPDSPNHKHFPNTFVAPRQLYSHEILYCFSTI